MNNPNVMVNRRAGIDYYEYNYDTDIIDVGLAQMGGQILSHIDIVGRYDVKLFIEIGTYMGGTLVYMIPQLELNPDFKYLGFEIIPSAVLPRVKDYVDKTPRCEIIYEDVFTAKNVKLIANRIAETDGCVYIFCDGGDKPKELSVFSGLLRTGDIISVHDYTVEQTGEIRDTDLNKLGAGFSPVDDDWRKDILWLPTYKKR